MTLKKISIITPSYNQGQYIEQTIDSVLSQNYSNLEYIIIDGGSTDNTVEIIKKYEKYLKYWVSEPDKGQSHAINKGLKYATGDIINWINSDDYYEKYAFAKVSDAFSKGNSNMVCFKSNVFGMENRISRGTDIFYDNLPKTIAFSRIDQPETFFSRIAVNKIGRLNENLHYCMDKEWFVRYLFYFGITGIKHIDEVILNFRYHKNSKSVSQKSGFYWEKDNIYLKIAKLINEEKVIQLLTEILGEKFMPNYNFKINNIDAVLAKSVIHNYIFLRGLEFYEINEKDVAKKFFKIINKNLLAVSDVETYNKIRLRNKFIPVNVLKLIRKITR